MSTGDISSKPVQYGQIEGISQEADTKSRSVTSATKVSAPPSPDMGPPIDLKKLHAEFDIARPQADKLISDYSSRLSGNRIFDEWSKIMDEQEKYPLTFLRRLVIGVGMFVGTLAFLIGPGAYVAYKNDRARQVLEKLPKKDREDLKVALDNWVNLDKEWEKAIHEPGTRYQELAAQRFKARGDCIEILINLRRRSPTFNLYGSTAEARVPERAEAEARVPERAEPVRAWTEASVSAGPKTKIELYREQLKKIPKEAFEKHIKEKGLTEKPVHLAHDYRGPGLREIGPDQFEISFNPIYTGMHSLRIGPLSEEKLKEFISKNMPR